MASAFNTSPNYRNSTLNYYMIIISQQMRAVKGRFKEGVEKVAEEFTLPLPVGLFHEKTSIYGRISTNRYVSQHPLTPPT